MWKIANLGYGNGRDSKTKHQFDKIFGSDAKGAFINTLVGGGAGQNGGGPKKF